MGGCMDLRILYDLIKYLLFDCDGLGLIFGLKHGY